MAKSPTPAPTKPPVDAEKEARFLRFAKERLNFLRTKDPAVLLARLQEDEDRSGLTRELKRAGELAQIKFDNFTRLGHIPLEAEEMAMKEVIRPESQLGGPILPDQAKEEANTLYSEWAKLPTAKRFLE